MFTYVNSLKNLQIVKRIFSRNFNYLAYPNQVIKNALKYFNNPKHTELLDLAIPINVIRKLEIELSMNGRFKTLDQLLELKIIQEIDLKHILDYLRDQFEKCQTFELLDFIKTDLVDKVNICVGIDFSPTEIAWCSMNSSLNIIEMNYIPLDLDFRNFVQLTKQICNIVDKISNAELYIVEKQPIFQHKTSYSTGFFAFYLLECAIHAALTTKFNITNNTQILPKIISLSEKEMCLITGLPNMNTQRNYICKIITDDTFYYSEVIRSVNLMKMNEKRHVDVESIYDARNISTQYLVDVYFEMLMNQNSKLVEFSEFFRTFNVPDHLKVYYNNLSIKHDVADAFWLSASYWFCMKKLNPNFYNNLSESPINLLPQ